MMRRALMALALTGFAVLTAAAQETVVPVSHGTMTLGPACASETCPTCVRITETKKVSHTAYAIQCKEVCLPKCSLFGLFGCGDCRPITVRQLVKRTVTEEKCVTKCVTAEEAAKK